MGKYYNIDPETCSIEELENAITSLGETAEYYETMQLSAKRFINSVYGVFGATNAFNLANTEIAESITLQGQDLIKFSVVQVNDYFLNKWRNDTEAHKRVSEIMKKKFPDFDSSKFEHLAETNPLTFNTLQVYGDTDSIISSSIIKTEKHPDGIFIKDYYNENANNVGEITKAGHESVHTTDKALNYDGMVKYSPVKRIIRHKVTKPKWKLKTASGKEVVCTGDHSLVIFRNGSQMVVKPNEIQKGDKVLEIQ